MSAGARQLSWTDAMFVRLETPSAPIHVNPVIIYDPSTAPGGRVTFKGILAQLESRLDRAPTFRQKLLEPPLGLTAPYWVDDPDFDLEFHVRHIALPKPGDWRQLCIQVARLHSRPIDLSRPPWELTVIEGLDAVEGLPPGCFAISLKVHHSAIDGVEGVELLSVMHDVTADAEPVPAPAPWHPRGGPSFLGLAARTVVSAAQQPVKATRVVASHLPGAVRGLVPAAGKLISLTQGPGPVPATRFNTATSPHRVFEARFYPFPDVKRIKAAVPGATVNDVCLTHVGGAMRRYLDAKGELPAEPLMSVCPVSIRSKDKLGSGGNMLSAMWAGLATDLADPVQRLAAIQAATSVDRVARQGMEAPALLEVAELLPGMLIGVGMKAVMGLPFGDLPIANTAITNVPASPVPFFFCGAQAVKMCGNGPLFPGLGMIHLIGTYCGVMSTSVTADRDAMPDPGFYGDCLDDAFAEMLAAV